MTILHSPFKIVLEEPLHNIYLLLSHSLTQLVGFTLGEARKLLGEQHHLLLINRYAVGILKNLLHLRQVVLYLLATHLAVYKIGNIIHWTRPVEGVHCYDVIYLGRL